MKLTATVSVNEAHEQQSVRTDRVAFLLIVVSLVGLAVVVGRVAQLQFAPSDALTEFVSARERTYHTFGARGDLLDRRGRVLASTRVGERLFIDPSEIEGPYSDTFASISRASGIEVAELARRVMPRLAENERRAADGRGPIRYVSVGGILSDAHASRVRALNLRGVGLEQRLVRAVPQDIARARSAALVGKVGVDHDGLVGAERAFDRDLSGERGRMRYVSAANGRAMWVDPHGIVLPTPGEDVRLSIDLEIQRILAEELERAVERNNAAGARGVIVDPDTGEVLAMADVVRTLDDAVAFDRELAKQVERGEHPWVRFRTIEHHEASDPALRRNRCVVDVYEPGSTFKSFMWSAVRERGLVGHDEMIDTEGGVWRTSYGRPLRDVARRDRMTWAEVLVRSSNIGMAKGTERMSAAQMHEAVRRFGFGERTNLALGGEAPGIVTSLNNWTKYTHTSVAMGHEVAVTPLQMVRAFSVFARTGERSGTLPDLTLSASDPFRARAGELRSRVLPATIALETRTTLRGVAERLEKFIAAAFPEEPAIDYAMFGKSGTAEIPRPDGRGYFDRQYNSSFIAGAPVDQPRIVVLIVVDDPGPERRPNYHYGSAAAGPAVRRVVQRTLEYLGVPKQTAIQRLAQQPLHAE